MATLADGRFSVPTNCRFEVDDAEKEWTWEHPFDFVFIRSMIGTFSDWTNILDKAYEWVNT